MGFDAVTTTDIGDAGQDNLTDEDMEMMCAVYPLVSCVVNQPTQCGGDVLIGGMFDMHDVSAVELALSLFAAHSDSAPVRCGAMKRFGAMTHPVSWPWRLARQSPTCSPELDHGPTRQLTAPIIESEAAFCSAHPPYQVLRPHALKHQPSGRRPRAR